MREYVKRVAGEERSDASGIGRGLPRGVAALLPGHPSFTISYVLTLPG